jgi:hypothetical protein
VKKPTVDQGSARALIKFLRAQLTIDRTLAAAAPPSPWALHLDQHPTTAAQYADIIAADNTMMVDTEGGYNGPPQAGAEHIHRHEPRRAQAAAAGLLLLVDAYADTLDNQAAWSEVAEDTATRVALALACRAMSWQFRWAPGYLPEWAPKQLRAAADS